VNKAEQRRELWRQRIAQQEKSGHSVSVFCCEQGLSEPSFYAWRQRLRKQNTPVRFALVETKPGEETVPPIELMLASEVFNLKPTRRWPRVRSSVYHRFQILWIDSRDQSRHRQWRSACGNGRTSRFERSGQNDRKHSLMGLSQALDAADPQSLATSPRNDLIRGA
jgi:hypothetical protein